MLTSLERCNAIFNRMTSDGWDITQPMKWGFFFCDDDPTKLQAVFAELEPSNYLLENIYQMEDVSFWTLHTSKTEILTPEKLFKRNVAFNELADYCEVNRYDGWDVERITTTP